MLLISDFHTLVSLIHRGLKLVLYVLSNVSFRAILILELKFLIEYITNSDYRIQMDLTFYNNSTVISFFDKNSDQRISRISKRPLFHFDAFSLYIISQPFSSQNLFSGPGILLTKAACFPYCMYGFSLKF